MTPHEEYLVQRLYEINGLEMSLIDDCFGCCTKAEPKAAWPCKKKKDENPMSSLSSATVITADSIERDQRKFLERRIFDIKYDLKLALRRQFGIEDDAPPSTVKEAIARIQAGKFVIPEKYENEGSYGLTSWIKWRDPALKEDKDGYATAKKQLDADFQTAEESAKLLPIADATKAMQDFKNWKYAAPTA